MTVGSPSADIFCYDPRRGEIYGSIRESLAALQVRLTSESGYHIKSIMAVRYYPGSVSFQTTTMM